MKKIGCVSTIIMIAIIAAGCSNNSTGPKPCSNSPCNGNDTTGTDSNSTFQVSDTTVINIKAGKTYQTIREFAASDAWATEIIGQNWPLPVRKQAAKKLFSIEMTNGTPAGIGLSGWRFHIGAGRGTLEGSGYRSGGWFRVQECFLSKDGSYDWTKQKGSRWFLRQAKSYGVTHFTGFSTSPPYFMTKSGYTFPTPDINGYNLRPKNYSKYADFLAHVAAHFKQEGMPFDVISPLNEPQYDWSHKVDEAKQAGSQASNKEISNVVKTINTAFGNQSVDTKIMIPEAGTVNALYSGNINSTYNQIKAFWSPSSPYYIGDQSHLSNYVAAHSYYKNKTVQSSIKNRKKIAQRVGEINPNLEYRQTEYSILGGAFGKAMPNSTPIDKALWIDRVVFNDLVYGNATGWSFWTAFSKGQANKFGLFGWTPNAENRSSSNGTIKAVKNLWAYGNFTRFVRPGMKRIQVVNKTYPTPVEAGKHVMATAFVNSDKNKLVVVIINYTDNNQKIDIGNLGSGINIAGKIDAYRTNTTLSLAHKIYQKNDIKVKGKSVVTLVAKMQ